MGGIVPVTIELDEFHMDICRQLGERRHKDSEGNNYASKLETDIDPLQAHINGCRGEMAASFALNISWKMTCGTYKDADLEPMIQVRHTSDFNKRMIVRDRDYEHGGESYIWVHTAGPANLIKVWGWAYGYEAFHASRRVQFKGHSPCWIMDHNDMHQIQALQEIIGHAYLRGNNVNKHSDVTKKPEGFPNHHYIVTDLNGAAWRHKDLLDARLHARRLAKVSNRGWEDHFIGAVWNEEKVKENYPGIDILDYEGE